MILKYRFNSFRDGHMATAIEWLQLAAATTKKAQRRPLGAEQQELLPQLCCVITLQLATLVAWLLGASAAAHSCAMLAASAHMLAAGLQLAAQPVDMMHRSVATLVA